MGVHLIKKTTLLCPVVGQLLLYGTVRPLPVSRLLNLLVRGGGGEPTTGMFSNLSNEGRTKVGEEGVMGSIQNI